MIDLKNVSKVYGKKSGEFKALNDVSVFVADGASVAIIGKSGSGKSTLMHVMSGLDHATSGIVTVADKDLTKMSEKQVDVFRNKQMGFIFQSFFIEANQSCVNNVSLPLEIAAVPLRKRKQLALQALKEVGLEDKADSKARNLSGGQKQRLAIARAIVNKPKLIFADEPTGNLDSTTGEKIVQILFGLNKTLGATLVMVTHDHDLANRCDAQIHVQDGKITKITGDVKAAYETKGPGLIKKAVTKAQSKLAASMNHIVKETLAIATAIIRIDRWPGALVRTIKNLPSSVSLFYTLILRSGRTLKSAKGRTFLTALAIAVGTFALSLTLAASNGAQKFVDQIISDNFDPAELIVAADESITTNAAPSTPQLYDPSFGSTASGAGATIQIKRITDEDIKKIKALDGVESVREGIQLNVLYVTREGQKKYVTTIAGLSPSQNPEILSGELKRPPENQTILIPEAFVQSLGFTSDSEAIGQKITVALRKPINPATLDPAVLLEIQSNPQKLDEITASSIVLKEFTIAAVLKKPTTSQPGTELYMYINNSDARSLQDISTAGTADFGKFFTVNVKVKNGETPSNLLAAQKEIKDLGYYSLSVKETQAFLNQAIGILQAIVVTFGAIAVVASIFGIINTMYISVLQRTREIGLMKALGMRRRDVGRLFRIEAALIGLFGGLIGTGLSLIAGLIGNPAIRKAIDYDGNLIIFEPLQVGILIIILIFVSIFSGWLPSRKAAKLDPVEALRTE